MEGSLLQIETKTMKTKLFSNLFVTGDLLHIRRPSRLLFAALLDNREIMYNIFNRIHSEFLCVILSKAKNLQEHSCF